MEGKSNFILHELVLVGGGHAHVHVLKMMGMQPMPNVRVTLVTRDLATPYSGMIPGYIAGMYTKDECHLDLFRLCVFANVKLIHAEVNRLDCDKKLIHCADGRPPIRYDTLSIDIGIVPSVAAAELAQHPHITPVKPIDRFANRWEAFLRNLTEQRLTASNPESSLSKSPIQVLVVGGGAGGVEVSFSIDQKLKDLKVPAQVTVVNRGATVMSSHSPGVQKLIHETLEARNIAVMNHTDLVSVEPINDINSIHKQCLVSTDGRKVPFDEAFWCTQAVAHPWLQGSGLALDENGFILINGTLESINQPGVFAVGDCCHNTAFPRPKAGVFAVRAGPPLLRNLRHLIQHPDNRAGLEIWEPQSEFLGIIGTADGSAIASKGGTALRGDYLWQLKDKIDRIWMNQYQELPKMDPTAAPVGSTQQQMAGPPISTSTQTLLDKAKMRCAGCGSKVGASVLARALKRLQRHIKQQRRLKPSTTSSATETFKTDSRVVAGIGDDAAVLTWPATSTPLRSESDATRDASPSTLSTEADASNAQSFKTPSGTPWLVQTLDYFRSFVADPYLFGRIAANHALSDLHAMLARPYSALALVTLPYATESITEDDLLHMLAGARSVLDVEDCALVGGHSAEGNEMALGFALTGHIPPQQPPQSSTATASVGLCKQIISVLYKGPLQRDMVLLTTKALGTGVLLAGAMAHRNCVSGRDITACYQSMQQSNARAARILAEMGGCVACTDVTGFGFLGHLVEMIRHETVSSSSEDEDDSDSDEEDGVCVLPPVDEVPMIVRLTLAQLPILDGAVACSSNHGVSSSLFTSNHRAAQQIINLEEPTVSQHPHFPLLFDPQTSGGLLACVPRARVEATVQALVNAGYHRTSVVGEVLSTDQVEELKQTVKGAGKLIGGRLNGSVFVEV